MKSSASSRGAKRRSSTGGKTRRWSGRVTRTSHAMDLEPGVFTGNDPRKIARSVARSAKQSTQLKSSPYRSAVSMITFYENRGGRNLPARKKSVLQRAKKELKREFHRS